MDISCINTKPASDVESGRASQYVFFILNVIRTVGTEPLVRWCTNPSACLAAQFVGTHADTCECNSKIVLNCMLLLYTEDGQTTQGSSTSINEASFSQGVILSVCYRYPPDQSSCRTSDHAALVHQCAHRVLGCSDS